jgi:REP element-mobilizing transposase RayT
MAESLWLSGTRNTLSIFLRLRLSALLQNHFIDGSAIISVLVHIISRDAPCYYLTSVAKDRLPVFRSDSMKLIACAALNEARRSGKFALYAYVIMPDHLHVVTDSGLSVSRTLQFINGIAAHHIIGYLKEHKYEASLKKLEHEVRPRRYAHSIWDHRRTRDSYLRKTGSCSKSITLTRIRCEPAW